MSRVPRVAVIVPAHDEAAVVEPMLRRLVESDVDAALEIAVVANGCRDETAARARSVSSRVVVDEIAVASKTAALTRGDDLVEAFPRAYIDADVAIDANTLIELARRLEASSALVAAPRLEVDTAGASWAVRQYFRVWAVSEYRMSGHIGSGVYMLTRAGRLHFDAFPDVIADDRFVQQLFAAGERMTPTDLTFRVRAPRTFAAHVRRLTRIARGNRQIAERYPELAGATASTRMRPLIARVVRTPSLWIAFPVYCVGYVIPRWRARRLDRRGVATAWNRDETTRV